jgi:hypothetical protein
MKNQLLISFEDPLWHVTSLLLLSRSLSLSFDSLTEICLVMYPFEFTLFEVHRASWMHIYMSFIRFGVFSGLIQIFCCPFLFSSWDCCDVCAGTLLPGPSRSIHFYSFFLPLSLDHFNWLIFKFTGLFLCLLKSPLVNFSFQLEYFLYNVWLQIRGKEDLSF